MSTMSTTIEPYKPFGGKRKKCNMYPERGPKDASLKRKYHESGTGYWTSEKRPETQKGWYFTKENPSGKSPDSSTADGRSSRRSRSRSVSNSRSRSRSRARPAVRTIYNTRQRYGLRSRSR